MGRKIGIAVVALAVIGIIAVKVRSGSTTSSPARAAVARAGLPATATAAALAAVMVADPREADMECPCGEIIRRVRAAKTRGVAVGEFAPDDADAARRYGVTVVFLDPGRKVVARHEGESIEVLAAITAGLARLEGAHR